MWPRETVEVVLRGVDAGLNDCELSRKVGVPRSTVREWRCNPEAVASRLRRQFSDDTECQRRHNFEELPGADYSYLLGMYLGDGCVSAAPREVWRLRIVLDSRYPGIVSECQTAMGAVMPKNKVGVQKRKGSNCVEVYLYSKHWPCLLPQHGKGKKHERRILLAPWQEKIIVRHRRRFLRGLIHSDGTRITATERKGSYVRKAPRYAFSNLSEDIKRLFCESCDALGIRWTRPSDRQIAIYRLGSVAVLDEFVGPKR
jgi:hypothetical protein